MRCDAMLQGLAPSLESVGLDSFRARWSYCTRPSSMKKNVRSQQETHVVAGDYY